MPGRVLHEPGPPPRLVVHASRIRQALAGLGAVAFVAVGVAALVLGEPVIGTLTVGFFGLCGVMLVRQVLLPGPALVVDHSGIADRAPPWGVGFVPWSQVTGLDIFSNQGTKIVVIRVADPEAVIGRAAPVVRPLVRLNARLCGSPVTLAVTTLPISAERLIDEIVAFAPTAPPGPVTHW